MRGKSLREFSTLRKTEAAAVQAGTPVKRRVENAEGFSTIELQAETTRGKSRREFSTLRR